MVGPHHPSEAKVIIRSVLVESCLLVEPAHASRLSPTRFGSSSWSSSRDVSLASTHGVPQCFCLERESSTRSRTMLLTITTSLVFGVLVSVGSRSSWSSTSFESGFGPRQSLEGTDSPSASVWEPSPTAFDGVCWAGFRSSSRKETGDTASTLRRATDSTRLRLKQLVRLCAN
jgi:hypothetical protein